MDPLFGIIDVDDVDENVDGPFRPFTFAVCDDGDAIGRDLEFDVRMAVGPRDVDRERPRFVFGEHTEHESSVQLTELFDIDRVACNALRQIFKRQIKYILKMKKKSNDHY